MRIVAPGAAILVLAAVGLVVLVALRMRVVSVDLLGLGALILAGPFSAYWAAPQLDGGLTIAIGNAVMLLAHPVWPNRVTGVVTAVGFASWLFWGAAFTFSGV